MSSGRLRAIDAVMQRHVDSGEIQGAVTALARRGKVVHFQAYGLMDVDARPGDAGGCDLSHGIVVEAGARRGGDAADRGGAPAPERRGRRPTCPSSAICGWRCSRNPRTGTSAPGSWPWATGSKGGKGEKGELPEHRPVPAVRAITIHDLLTHTSGIDASRPGLGGFRVAGTGPARRPWPATFRSTPACCLDFQPGTRWGYSPRVGHDVVARIIEIVSGLPYDEFVRAPGSSCRSA